LKLAQGLRWHRLIKARRLQQKAAPGDLVFGCDQKIRVANSKKNSIKTIRYELKNGIAARRLVGVQKSMPRQDGIAIKIAG
jgi:hypothetical protein